MLSIGAKKYIRDNVKEQFFKNYKQNNNDILLNNKIDNFEKLLEIYSDDEKYKNNILSICDELERATRDGKMLSFYKVAQIDMLLEILFNINNENNMDYSKSNALKKLKILDSEELFENGKIVDNYETHLKTIKNEKILPYIKTIYICENEIDFQKIEENKMPIYIYWQYVSDLLLTYLDLSYKVRDDVFEKYLKKKLDLNTYLKTIIDNYESKINFKYIPSSVLKEESDEDDEKDRIPFIEVNEDNSIKKIKLVGYAGVGKTTTLEYIEYTDAINFEKNNKIPVLISLITVEKNEDIEKLIARKLIPDTAEDNLDLINYLIDKNELNLYFDGVNEIRIADFYEKKEFLNKLNGFLNSDQNKDLKVIVTDRDNSEVSALNTKNTYLIQGMTETDINQFIEGNTSKENVDKVKKVISENKEFSEIIMHPIMLKNLITIIECDEEIPENIEALSEVYLNSIIKRECEEKKDKTASYINDVLKYMVKKVSENEDNWSSNLPTSYFKVVDIFNEYAEKENLDYDSNELLNLIKKMGIMREVEFQKYAFTDENFFHIYYYKSIE